MIYNENGTLTLIISSFTSHSCLRMKMTKCPDTSHMFMKVQGFRPSRVSLIQKFLNNMRHILIVLNVLQLRYIYILYKSKIETELSKIRLTTKMCSGVKFQQCSKLFQLFIIELRMQRMIIFKTFRKRIRFIHR